MSPRLEALLGLLADGVLHSGAALASDLGVSRSAVWKLVGELRALGIEVESLPRRGYRLPVPVELLDPARILAGAEERGRSVRADLEVLFETGSTNDWLYDAPAPAPGRPRVVFAELQRAGRGRRGRNWLAPFGSGLTFSVAWTFAETPADLPALGLAVGVAVAEALREVGYAAIGLKWPNDLLWRRRKLGGLLLQVRAEAGGGASIVAGLGVNLRLPAAARLELDATGALAVTDLHEIRPDGSVGRNRLAATLMAAILGSLEEFGTAGFAAFAPRWRGLDALAGQPVQVSQGAERISGLALGVADDGALLVEVAGRRERFHSGDVSLRPATVSTAP